MTASKLIELLESSRVVDGRLHVAAFGLNKPDPNASGWGMSSADAAERLLTAVLAHLSWTPARVDVDVRSAELHGAEFFGRSDHPFLEASDDPLVQHRLAAAEGGRVQVVSQVRLADVMTDIVRETGWFSTGAYGILLRPACVLDVFQDGVYLELVSAHPLA